ncbi:hypothetical protein ACFWSP_00755 [Streptomyces sp. NPDC058618]|uniref:hypothetical protein n=1 Tax=unclassified Streptomyces TaxID=2593676 RepID=UPI00365559CF
MAQSGAAIIGHARTNGPTADLPPPSPPVGRRVGAAGANEIRRTVREGLGARC